MKSLPCPPHPQPLLPQTANPLLRLNGQKGGRARTQQGKLPQTSTRASPAERSRFQGSCSDDCRDHTRRALQGCFAEPSPANGCLHGDGGTGTEGISDGAIAAIPPYGHVPELSPARKPLLKSFQMQPFAWKRRTS